MELSAVFQPKRWAEKASREDNRKQDPTRTCSQSGVKIEHCSRCPVSIFSTGMPHSTVIKRTPLVRLLLYWLQKILFDFFAPAPNSLEACSRPHCASLIARPRRRGDRVRWRREFVGLFAVQPLRKPAIGWANQRS